MRNIRCEWHEDLAQGAGCARREWCEGLARGAGCTRCEQCEKLGPGIPGAGVQHVSIHM